MRRRQLFLVFLALSTATAAERSVSTSRQFVVYGGDIRLRGAICDVAEQAKNNLLALLGERDQWRIPIVIDAELPQANFPEAPAARLQLAQSEAGLKLQLDLKIGADLLAANLERELLRALLLEIMYRDAAAPRAGTPYVEPPRWLVEGIVARERDSETGAELLNTVVTGAKATSLAAFLQQRAETLDSTSLQLYRAYSAALVDLLLRDNDAPQRFGQFVRELHYGSVDPLADLVAHFPQLNGMSGIADVWKQHVARIARGTRYALLRASDTERALDALLHVTIGDTTYSIDEFARILRVPGSQTALQHLREQLLLFEPRANPTYRDTVVEYQELASLLARGSTRHVAQRLARIKARRQQLATHMSGIDDYLNWFEATQQTTSSGLFIEYIKSVEATNQAQGRRRDPISVYLDSIETQIE